MLHNDGYITQTRRPSSPTLPGLLWSPTFQDLTHHRVEDSGEISAGREYIELLLGVDGSCQPGLRMKVLELDQGNESFHVELTAAPVYGGTTREFSFDRYVFSSDSPHCPGPDSVRYLLRVPGGTRVERPGPSQAKSPYAFLPSPRNEDLVS